MPQTFILPEEITDWSFKTKSEGKSIALVPTMGALHQGHLSLIAKALGHADEVIVSIFVNPKQFGPDEDFSKYPRTLKADIEKLEGLGVACVYAPNAAHIYPEGYQTYIENAEMSDALCGSSRPGHFRGVLTVVLKLFNVTFADVALFGKKDYQQFRMIEKMVSDLNVPVHVVGSDTVREANGLAMSSRNTFLNSEQREAAGQIYRGLTASRGSYQAGERSVAALIKAASDLISENSELEIEYLELKNQNTLQSFSENVDGPPVMLTAVRCGNVRLIDNLELDSVEV
ncbi:pantoate--beta-alanine ligase [Oligoflexaceae bacterium]|nr:pantoate--beta-alanine ligase [Oligoflexaceae bacterium]